MKYWKLKPNNDCEVVIPSYYVFLNTVLDEINAVTCHDPEDGIGFDKHTIGMIIKKAIQSSIVLQNKVIVGEDEWKDVKKVEDVVDTWTMTMPEHLVEDICKIAEKNGLVLIRSEKKRASELETLMNGK